MFSDDSCQRQSDSQMVKSHWSPAKKENPAYYHIPHTKWTWLAILKHAEEGLSAKHLAYTNYLKLEDFFNTYYLCVIVACIIPVFCSFQVFECSVKNLVHVCTAFLQVNIKNVSLSLFQAAD